jgi:hypothetical protein
MRLARGGRLGVLAISDFRLRRSVRHLDLELDQELHDVLLSLRASPSRLPPRLAPVEALLVEARVAVARYDGRVRAASSADDCGHEARWPSAASSRSVEARA